MSKLAKDELREGIQELVDKFEKETGQEITYIHFDDTFSHPTNPISHREIRIETKF
jgi:hypothetical protein